MDSSKLSCKYAMWPSREIWCAPAGEKGETTSETWAKGRMACTMTAVRDSTEGAVTGPVVVITISFWLPDCPGKARSRTFWIG